jgi:alcohol dehydrogenase
MGSSTVPVPLDYTQLMMTGREVIGHFMYPRWAPARLLDIVAAGALDLDAVPVKTFPLQDFEAAMDAAAEPGAPLVVVAP